MLQKATTNKKLGERPVRDWVPIKSQLLGGCGCLSGPIYKFHFSWTPQMPNSRVQRLEEKNTLANDLWLKTTSWREVDLKLSHIATYVF